MITQTLQRIAALRAEADALEAKIAAARDKELAALPAKFGFNSAADFIAAVTAAAAGGSQKTGKAKAAAKPAGKARRKRAVITDATREAVKKLVLAGKTGAAIAKAVGISLPSVQNVKRALGLVGKAVKAKGKSAAKPNAPAKPKAPAKKKPRKRAVITEATKADVKKLVDEGKTAKEVASAVGISVPSVQNIKKELGLVKKDE